MGTKGCRASTGLWVDAPSPIHALLMRRLENRELLACSWGQVASRGFTASYPSGGGLSEPPLLSLSRRDGWDLPEAL